jgi:endonuclease/exonuclease/phosphatase family metal-dependent hydrolase
MRIMGMVSNRSMQPLARGTVLLGALALVATGCARPLRRPEVTTGPALTVMTYNVNFGLGGDPAGLAAIELGLADLVLLQETTPAWERAIRRRLGRSYRHVHFRHGPGAGGLAVLSRFPVQDRGLVPPPGRWVPAWRLLVDAPVGRVQVLLVHLRPMVSDSGSWVSGYLSTGDYRRLEIVHFSSSLDPALPTLIAGDFNEDVDGAAIQHLVRTAGFRSVLEEYAPDARTWRWRVSVLTLTHTFDHILYDRRLVPRSARVLGAGRSDHLPVVAVFQAAPADAQTLPALTHASGGGLSLGL